jgi:hypothetical protein
VARWFNPQHHRKEGRKEGIGISLKEMSNTIRIEDPDTNPCSYSHLIFLKVPKICIVEKTASSTNGAEKEPRSQSQDHTGKLDFNLQKTETRSQSLTLY